MIGERSWQDSLHFVSQWSRLAVVSDDRAAEKANADLQVPARAVDSLDGQMDVRPLDALRQLALASAMDLADELRGASSFWAVLRYLGAFDTSAKHGCLTLSDAGERVRSNQRRLLSEDLGVAFGLVVATAWIRSNLPQETPVWVADVDNLTGPLARLASTTTSRPDLVVMAQTADDDRVRMGLVECKGTRSSSEARPRLATACKQVTSSGLEEKLPCLAVSGVFSRSKIEVSALEVGTGPDELDSSDPRVAEVLRASSLGLALFSGNVDGAQRLEGQPQTQMAEPTRDSARQSRVSRRRARRSRSNRGSIGVRSEVSLAQGSIEVHQGVDGEIDKHITDGDVDEIVASQRRRRRATLDRPLERSAVGTPVSEGADGSTLEVTVR